MSKKKILLSIALGVILALVAVLPISRVLATGYDITEQNSGTINNLNSVFFTDTLTGWAVGDNSTILHTTNGGTDWSAQTAPIGTGPLKSVYFVDSKNGWAVGADGEGASLIIYTTNGGTDWLTQATAGPGWVITSVYFTDANNGWATGLREPIDPTHTKVFLTTNNGGVNWSDSDQIVEHPLGETPGLLNSVHFIDANNGWAVGNSGTIVKNGGSIWTWDEGGSGGNNLLSVYLVDANNGWAVGENGTITHKHTGCGTNWCLETSGTAQHLNGVYSADSNNAWAVGNIGTIVYTTDGGNTWTPLTSGTSDNLNSVCSASPTIWVAGDGGTILKIEEAEEAVPEFTTITIIIAAVVGFGIYFLIRQRREKKAKV